MAARAPLTPKALVANLAIASRDEKHMCGSSLSAGLPHERRVSATCWAFIELLETDCEGLWWPSSLGIYARDINGGALIARLYIDNAWNRRHLGPCIINADATRSHCPASCVDIFVYRNAHCGPPTWNDIENVLRKARRSTRDCERGK